MKQRLTSKRAEIPALPGDLPALLLGWYSENARSLPWRESRDPYRVLVSEVMLQQTRAETVKAYFIRFIEAFPTLSALASAEEAKLLKLWEGLGYYSRALNLRKAARELTDCYGGVFPSDCDALRKLPGVGEYTSGAVASICFEKPTPAVDGNVVRIISRIAGLYGAAGQLDIKKQIAAALEGLYPEGHCGDFTQSLMELGAVVCLPSGVPKCGQCPVSHICRAYLEARIPDAPGKRQRKEKKIQEKTVFVLYHGDSVAVRRREETGLLAGLWEFPNVPGKLDEAQAAEVVRSWGARPLSLLYARERTHVFTHVRWDMICYYLVCGAKSEHFTWAELREVKETLALPTAFKRFLEVPHGEETPFFHRSGATEYKF